MKKLPTWGRLINIIIDEINRITEVIDKKLKDYINISCKYEDEIIKAINYSLFTGGKRLRPIFTIKTFELFNKDIEKVLPFASAIEMIHTYSLIHDDLPAMDNDKLRRGKPTNHIEFGEAMAILAGDGLLNLAFEILFDNLAKKEEFEGEIKRKLKAAKLISQASGIGGMIGGQVIDILSEFKDMDEKKLLYMYERKTGALFRASILTGAIIGGADYKEIEILSRFANLLGISYQIQDDILDIDEDNKINKITYLTYSNRHKAKNDLEKLTMECFSLLNQLKGKDIDFLMELTKLLINREN